VGGAFVAAMEDVLELYAEPYDPRRPQVCLDEKSVSLHADASPTLPARPGILARSDYEYVRCGTANLFVCVEPLRGYRHIAVTDRRTKQDYAQVIKWLVDEAYPEVEVIRLVQDNLNTHLPGSLYDAFEPSEARRLLRKLEFHYTPVHGSWLNMAEIEIAIIGRECLRRRAGDKATLERQLAALETERNEQQRNITWSFTAYDARTKLHRLYPIPQS
jgi:DDE superfamily endonuclease